MTFMAYVPLLLSAGISLLIVFFSALFFMLKRITSPWPKIERTKSENYFLNPDTIENEQFPTIDSQPTLDLSVIIPAYEEEKRLPAMLDECLEFLLNKSKSHNFTFEVIVVSDGSRDGTVPFALKYSKVHTSNKVRVMELAENRGKGGAVRLGMLSARGRYLLFADADGATKFSDYDRLEKSMQGLIKDWQQDAIVVGSRAHLEKDSIASRSLFRTILMHGFHFLVWSLAVRNVHDTQCGFKLLSRGAASKLFKIMHVERWAFDVELLYLAEQFHMPIAEIAVNWTEIEGSKLTPFWSWLQMGTDLFLIWFRYSFGIWQARLPPVIDN